MDAYQMRFIAWLALEHHAAASITQQRCTKSAAAADLSRTKLGG